MEPMRPMEPMKPMKGAEPWWPEDLGSPASSGGQNGLRYAFFPEKHRLMVEREGKTTTYDSGDYRISGVQQQSGGTVSFASQNGTVDLDSLKQVG